HSHMQHAQRQAMIRMEWGLRGAQAVTQGAAVAVVIDVLSFTTTLTVAVDAGAEVYPFPSNDASAREFARRHDAALAIGRVEAREAGGQGPGVSLSPTSIRAAPAPARIVLPSPNGSALAHTLASGTAIVVGA